MGTTILYVAGSILVLAAAIPSGQRTPRSQSAA